MTEEIMRLRATPTWRRLERFVEDHLHTILALLSATVVHTTVLLLAGLTIDPVAASYVAFCGSLAAFVAVRALWHPKRSR